MNNQIEITNELQQRATNFLQSFSLRVNGTSIYLKEIEVYYFEEGVFEDYTVHRNELQADNKHHFYIHRRGRSKSAQPITGTRGGCDFVLSDSANVYFSFLIRSIVIDNELVVGPRNSLNAILRHTNLTYNDLERVEVELVQDVYEYDVLVTPRVGIGNPTTDEDKFFETAELRFILCDEFFREKDKRSNIGYKSRTEAIDRFLKQSIATGKMSKKQAIDYSWRWYGSVSKWLKDYKDNDKE